MVNEWVSDICGWAVLCQCVVCQWTSGSVGIYFRSITQGFDWQGKWGLGLDNVSDVWVWVVHGVCVCTCLCACVCPNLPACVRVHEFVHTQCSCSCVCVLLRSLDRGWAGEMPAWPSPDPSNTITAKGLHFGYWCLSSLTDHSRAAPPSPLLASQTAP